MTFQRAGWVAKDSKDDAAATATKAAVVGSQHVVYGVDASFSLAVSDKLLQIKDGTTVVWEGYLTDRDKWTFPTGIAMTVGNACSAVLAASGTGGTLGKVNLHGNTLRSV